MSHNLPALRVLNVGEYASCFACFIYRWIIDVQSIFTRSNTILNFEQPMQITPRSHRNSFNSLPGRSFLMSTFFPALKINLSIYTYETQSLSVCSFTFSEAVKNHSFLTFQPKANLKHDGTQFIHLSLLHILGRFFMFFLVHTNL